MLMFPKSTANIFIILLTLYDLYLVPFLRYLEPDDTQTQQYFSFLFRLNSLPSVLQSLRISLSQSFCLSQQYLREHVGCLLSPH